MNGLSNLSELITSPYWWPDKILEIKGQGQGRCGKDMHVDAVV